MKRTLTTLLALTALAACGRKKAETLTIQTAPIERRDIVVDASATGAVEPINIVEVKSKSSGQITQMTVETGTLVSTGDLLVQLDTRDVKNQYDQADADVRAAQAKLDVSAAQKKRSDDLFQQRIVTAQEHETAALDYANAQASLIRAQTSLDLAKQRLEDATVRAPIAGTVIEKTVSLGQVITSATSSASGGTTILKMADLNRVRVRALVNETDIGSVHPGQEATVTVDAYPDRPFRGTVEKIEPQAVVQQSVTMFPVLVTLTNLEGLLKPGMNGEVSVLVERRTGVLAVPNDAVRTTREGVATATMLGLNPDTVQAQIRAQMAEAMRGFGGFGGGNGGGNAGRGGDRGAARQAESRGDVALSAEVPQQGGQGQQGRGGFQMPEVTDQQCAAVRTAFQKHPDAQTKLDALRDRMRNGELDRQQMMTESQAIYGTMGVDGRVAAACRFRERQQGGGQQVAGAQSGAANGAQNGATGGATNGATQGRRAGRGGQPQSAAEPVPVGEFPVRNRTRPGLVFIAANGTYEPRVVRLGVGNLDYTEVVSGVKEGERVALLAAAAAQARREEQNQRFRGMGGGVPGMQRQQNGQTAVPGGGGPPRGGGGGGPRP